jgi:hypothetical protein
MAKMENIFVNVVSEFDGKALTKGQKHLSQFEKTVQKVGKTFAAAFAVHKIVAFGQNSVKAFTEAEASAKALNVTLKNTGSLMAFPDAIAGIKRLSVATGVADTALTDAFTQLYSSTGDATQAQKDLALAVDVSRGTTKNLTEVVDALSAGYRGNTKGLGNLNAGLDAATLATKDMEAITKQLAILQGGQAAAYAETYAGKIDILNVAFDNLKVTVGQGLVMAFEEATGNRGIGGATNAMENFGYTVDAVLIKLAQLSTGNFLDNLGLGFINSTLSAVTKGWNYLLGVDETRLLIQNEIWKNNTKTYEAAAKQKAEQDKINDAYQKRLKLQTSQQKAALDSAKKLAAAGKILDRAGTLFDLDQIQIYAALQGQITDNERLRLDLQLALLTKNADAADKLSQELLISQLQTTDLAKTISNLPKALNPFSEWPKYIQDLIGQIAQLKASTQIQTLIATSPSQNPVFTGTASPYIGAQGGFDAAGTYVGTPFGQATSMAVGTYDSAANYIGTPFGQAGGNTTNINIDANNMVDSANMVRIIQQALIDINKGGYSQTPAGYGF